MSNVKECYLCEVGYGFQNINGERGFSRGSYISSSEVSKFIAKRNYYSVFRSAYSYNNPDIDKSDLYGDLYLDFDDVQDFERVRKDALQSLSYFKILYSIPPEYIQIYYSGNKGIHLVIPATILGVEPMPLLNGIYKYIAMSVKTYSPNKTIDTQIYDNKRLFRIPNTLHEKSHLFKIPITLDELRNLSEHDIKNLATRTRTIPVPKFYGANNDARKKFQQAMKEYYEVDKEAGKNSNVRHRAILNFTPPCIQHILENGAEEGQRNITIACLTGFYKSSGKTLNETIELIEKWNDKNIKPTGSQELKKTVKSMFNNNKMYGCSTLKLISICNESQCKLSKKKETTKC